jgi:nitroreductase
MDVLEAVRSKRAVRMFSDKPVSKEDILAVVDAGRRSQSSKNTQPWQFIVIQNRDTLKALSQTGDFAGHLAGANFAVALIGTKEGTWNSFDLGQASAYMQLAAWELGIGSCIAAIYHPDKAKAILGVPPEMSCFVAISFGYPADDFVPAKMGGRKPVDEIVKWERWD